MNYFFLCISGEESDPYIVYVADDNMRTQIVTVTDRFLVEKDHNGTRIHSLDLHCLLVGPRALS